LIIYLQISRTFELLLEDPNFSVYTYHDFWFSAFATLANPVRKQADIDAAFASQQQLQQQLMALAVATAASSSSASTVSEPPSKKAKIE